MSVALGLGLGFFVLTAVGSVLGIGLVSGYQNTSQLLRQKAELLVTAEVNQASHCSARPRTSSASSPNRSAPAKSFPNPVKTLPP